jgi:hypothetical protein
MRSTVYVLLPVQSGSRPRTATHPAVDRFSAEMQQGKYAAFAYEF